MTRPTPSPTLYKRLLGSALNFVFPPLCLHCGEDTVLGGHLFCKGCAGYFELINPLGRCSYCFAFNEGGRRPCPDCIEKRRWDVQIASALDYVEAVSTLVLRQKYGRMPYLAKTAAAFMVAQWSRLQWPEPDLIVPVPRRLWFQGANHAHILATEVGKLLGVRVAPIVKRPLGELSQARLGKKRRESYQESFFLRGDANVLDKTILLIDDVMTTGTTLRSAADALLAVSARKVYALTLARSIHT